MARPSDSPGSSSSNDYRSSADSSSSDDEGTYYAPKILRPQALQNSIKESRSSANAGVSPDSRTQSMRQRPSQQRVHQRGDLRPAVTSQSGKNILILKNPGSGESPPPEPRSRDTGSDNAGADRDSEDDSSAGRSRGPGARLCPDTGASVRPSRKPDFKSSKRKRGKQYEYGEAVAGYRFLSDKPPSVPRHPKENGQTSSGRHSNEGQNSNDEHEVENSNDYDDDYIDVHQFDRYKNLKKRRIGDSKDSSTTSSGNMANLKDLIASYWSRDQFSPTGKSPNVHNLLPIINPHNRQNLLQLDDPMVGVDSITPGVLGDFYDTSARLLGLDKRALLKQERVKWHPDKHGRAEGSSSHAAASRELITRLFQVINELWEALQ